MFSVYVNQLAGDYDDQLEWPFVGNFDFELLKLEKQQRTPQNYFIN